MAMAQLHEHRHGRLWTPGFNMRTPFTFAAYVSSCTSRQEYKAAYLSSPSISDGAIPGSLATLYQ